MTSAYYPLRMWQSRTDIRQAYTGFAAGWPQIGPRESEKIAMAAVFKRLTTGGVDMSSGSPYLAVMSQEAAGVLAWGEWAMKGKRIVSIAPELTRAFLHSDCGDMRIEDVAPEHPAMYLHFNMSEDAPIRYSHDTVQFEGAYLLFDKEQSLRVVLCGRQMTPLDVAHAWLERYDLRIRAEHFGIPAQDAIDEALADDQRDLHRVLEQMPSTEKGLPPGTLEAAQGLAERMKRDHGAFRQAVALVLNALAYLRTQPEDTASRWSDGAPLRLVKQTEVGHTPKELERATSKLWSLGHVPIFHVGEEFGRQYRAPHDGLRAHWRRGHWRRQAHGPSLALRKLIWIHPMAVGAKPISVTGD